MAPFSFQSLYALTRQRGEIPCDPYDMIRWPIVRRGNKAYVRYRFHTRNLEMPDALKKLSRMIPAVRIGLVTHCLDDGDFGAYSFHKGGRKGKWLGDDWRTPFWEQTARDLGIDVDDEDEVAEQIAESRMRGAAMRIATGLDRTYQWTGGRVYRDLWEVRAGMAGELANAFTGMECD